MFRVDSRIAGDILGITPEAYRQRLSRVRKKHHLEGQLLRRVAEDAAVKLPYPEDQSLYQLLKLSVGRLVPGFVGVVPFPGSCRSR